MPNLPHLFMGVYSHFKGSRYLTVTLAQSSEDESWHVVYQSLDSSGRTWVRPFAMWNEVVKWPDGVMRPRFVLEKTQ